MAAGGRALGAIPVDKQPVLYLALEDGHRRLQSRCRRLLAEQAITDGIEFIIKATPEEALQVIAEFLNKHERGLVILDTLGKVKPPKQSGQESYQADYAIGSQLKDLVDAAPGSTPPVVDHARKAESADFVDGVSGTMASPDGRLIMSLDRKRHSDDAILSVTGRDIVEAEYALHADDGVLWQLDGDDLRAARKTVQQRREADQLDSLSDRTSWPSSRPGRSRRPPPSSWPPRWGSTRSG